jgi:hypothetical protein
MYGDPVAARASAHQKSAGKSHEKHQNGNKADGDADVVAIRRRSPWPRTAAIAIVVATVAAVIASPWRWRRAASSTADVFDDYFDFRCGGCSWHDELL